MECAGRWRSRLVSRSPSITLEIAVSSLVRNHGATADRFRQGNLAFEEFDPNVLGKKLVEFQHEGVKVPFGWLKEEVVAVWSATFECRPK